MKIHHMIVVLGMLWSSMAAAEMNLNIGIEYPSESIGIDVLAYPELYVVPGYPVYFAPRLNMNYFFYDGMYWVYQDDNWYMASWYDGPWLMVDPMDVPVFILRIPVRYYRQPPIYFRQWMPDGPPHWDEQWGPDWEKHRRGWNRWNQFAVPPPAPLPHYQRQYSGAHYPQFIQQQREIESQHYRYRSRDPEVWKHHREPSGRGMPGNRNSMQPNYQQNWPDDPAAPRFQSPRGGEGFLGPPPDFPQPEGMNIQAPPGQSPVPPQHKQRAPSATDQQDYQDSNGTGSMPKNQKQKQ